MTLTQTAIFTKRFLLGLAILLVMVVSGWISYSYYYNKYYLPNRPAVVIPPEVKFGMLPKPDLPQTTASSSNFAYSIDTESGDLPANLPKLIKVFYIPQLSTTLLAANKARELAVSLNFDGNPEIINSTLYQFKDGLGGEMMIDLNSNNFFYKRGIASNSATLSPEIAFSSDEVMISQFKDFLSKRNLIKESLQNGRFLVYLDKFSKKESSSAIVTVWPKDIENLKVVTPDFKFGLIKTTLVTLKDDITKYSDFDYIYWEPDKQNSSTYPIKDVNMAFNELKGGKGTVIIEPKNPKVSLNSIYLAYFESKSYTQYIQPVYVFEGEDFVAYVPAIVDQYLEGQSQLIQTTLPN